MQTRSLMAILFLLLASPTMAGEAYQRSTGRVPEVKTLSISARGATPTGGCPMRPAANAGGLPVQALVPPGDSRPATLDTPYMFGTFDGVEDNGPYPPQFRFAVGEDEIVQVLSDRLRITDKCGTTLADWSYTEFFQNAPVAFDQADVIYDRWGDRMFLMAAGHGPGPGDYSMYIARWEEPWAVSQGGYYFVSPMEYDGAILTSNHSREMRMGLTSDMLYVAADQWSNGPPSTFQYSKIRVFDLATLVTTTDFTGMSNADLSPAVSIRPAKMHSYAGTPWLLNSAPGGDNYLTLWGLSGPPTNPSLSRYTIGISAYAPPVDGYQPDSTLIEMGDCRIGNAAFHADTLWTTFIHAHEPSPGNETNAIRVVQIKASTQSGLYEAAVYTPSGYLGYPQLDVDGQGRALVSALFTASEGGLYPPLTAYGHFESMGGFSNTSLIPLAAPLDNYADPGSPPWKWGFVHGAARDPVDNTSMWIAGAHSLGMNPPRWATTIGMTSFEPPGFIAVTSSGSDAFAGEVGSFLYPDKLEYYLTNQGGSVAHWSFSGADTLVESMAEGTTARPLPPGATDTVTVYPSDLAYAQPPGLYYDEVTFTECTSGSIETHNLQIAWGDKVECPGAYTKLWLNGGQSTSMLVDQKRGVFGTALKGFEVCSVGMFADLLFPQVITARVYEANGNTRGALVGAGSALGIPKGYSYHNIPVNCVLESCQDYNITVEWGWAAPWDYWDTAVTPVPQDAYGVFRVRAGESNGSVDAIVPQLHLLGSALDPGGIMDLSPPGVTWSTTPDTNGLSRIQFTPLRTMNIAGVSIEAGFPALPGTLYAIMGDHVVNGAISSAIVYPDLPGVQEHFIPLSGIAYEGHAYDVTAGYYQPALVRAAPLAQFPEPWPADEWAMVHDWNVQGSTLVKHLKLWFKPFVAGSPFHLGKPDEPPPFEVTGGSMQHGAYITANADMNAWALEWFADVPAGSTIAARVYEASGTSRGALITEGALASHGPGMRWHHVPIAVEFAAGTDYDLEIVASGTNLWRWWTDETGMPIVYPGVLTVRDGERNGNANIVGLIEMQLWACNPIATAIDQPVRPPQFFVSAPYPNPAGRQSVIDYSLDRAGTVEIVLYDVAGRRVATVLESTWQPAGPGTTTLNTAGLPAGVYFVRMQTPAQSVSRKVTVLR